MTGEELNILSKIKVRPVEEQRDFLIEQNMLLTGKIATLEKENAELKAQLESERDLPAIAYMQGAEKQKKKDEEQLTKAKELLKQWLQTSKASSCDNINIVTDTEQFLKSN